MELQKDGKIKDTPKSMACVLVMSTSSERIVLQYCPTHYPPVVPSQKSPWKLWRPEVTLLETLAQLLNTLMAPRKNKAAAPHHKS